MVIISGYAATQPSSNLSNNDSENITESPTTEDLTDINNSIDTVILASTANYPDALVSDPASDRIGVPILLTEDDELSDATAQTLEDANVSNVIIVGGPAVVSNDVKNSTEDIVDSVSRVWGLTEVGTSSDVATFFWDASESATVVQYNTSDTNQEGYKLLAAAKERAISQNEPLLVSSQGDLSNSTINALEELEVENIAVYNAGEADRTNEIQLEGVDVEMNRGGETGLATIIQENLSTQFDSNISAVVSSDYTDVISTTNLATSTMYIFPETQLNQTVEYVEDSEVEQINLIGQENQTEEVQQAFNDSDIDITMRDLAEDPVVVANELLRSNLELWIDRQETGIDQWESELQVNQLESELQDARDNLNNTSLDQDGANISSILDEAESALESEELVTAQLLIQQANSELEELNFMNLSSQEIQDRVREETESLNTTNSTIAANNTTEETG